MVYSIIPKSQLEGAFRLDAEYYQPKYLDAIKKIKTLKTKHLSELSKLIRCGPFGSNLLCDTYIPNGVIVIRPFNLNNLSANSGDLVSISYEDCQKQHLRIYKNEDVFVGRVGDVRFGIAESFTNELTISPNIIAVRTDPKELDPYFLVTLLNSKYGYLQVERGLKIVAQPTIQTEDVRKILIPIIEKEKQIKIRNLLINSFTQRELSKSFYSQAQELLLSSLGLTDFVVDQQNTNIVNLSDIIAANRLDAEYFQKKYEILSKIILKNNGKKLKELVTIKKGFEPGSEAYQESGKLFIRVSSLTKDGLTNRDQKYLNNDLYLKFKNEYQPNIGEILLTKDASPGIAYVLKDQIEGIISGGILRLRTKININPEYLALCLNSVVGQLQVIRDSGGSIISHWRPDQINNILIPILSNNQQAKIGNLLIQSHIALKNSKELLAQAKSEVEQMIDNYQLN